MTPQERDLIRGVAESLRAADRSWSDPDAVKLIHDEIASQPGAAYLLTQRVIVSELALKQAQAKIEALEAQLKQGGGGGSGRSFLGGLFGGGSSAPTPSPQAPPPGYGYGPQPQPGYGPPPAGGGAGGFLKTAAAAAAGAIGGELIYDGLKHLVDGGHGFGGFAPTGGFIPDAFASGGIPLAMPTDGDAPPAVNDWDSTDAATDNDGAGDFDDGADAGGDLDNDNGGESGGGDW